MDDHDILKGEGLMKLPEVLKIIPVSKSTWYKGVKDGHFPKSVLLGERAVAWKKEDIKNLIATFN